MYFYPERKKQRGQKRRLHALYRKIDRIVPFEETKRNYERFRVGNFFIGHSKTSSHVKTAFCRKVIEKTEQILSEKPEGLPFCKVVAIIYPRELIRTQIIIFYDEDFYDYILSEKGHKLCWTKIEDKSRSFTVKRNIKTSLDEKGYIDRSPSLDGIEKQELWLFGEV